MNERIKELRKVLGLSAEKFGENIGITKSSISRMENGISEPTDSTIMLILKTSWNGQYVNEEWLRTGKGEMFTTLSKETRLGEAIARLGELPMITEIISILGTEASDEFLIELESLLNTLINKKD